MCTQTLLLPCGGREVVSDTLDSRNSENKVTNGSNNNILGINGATCNIKNQEYEKNNTKIVLALLIRLRY